MNKKSLALLTALFLSAGFLSYAQDASNETPEQNAQAVPKYKIGDINYTSKGITKQSALKNSVEINTDMLFSSRKEVDDYSDNIVQQLMNKRIFDDVTKEGKENEPDENGIIKVDYDITVTESKNFLIFPKPNYSSNNGFELKIKLKDSNFLGFMNTLNVDLNTQFGTSSAPDDFSKVTLGTNFDYAYPFQLGPTNNTWNNDFAISWFIGDVPEFSYSTGITTSIPFSNNQLQVTFTQSIARKNSYETYGDALYLTENGKISLPLTLGYINDVIPLRYTPSINATYNWDFDGINPGNSNLKGPSISIGQDLAISSVNWKGNFRDGYSISLNHSIAYNFSSENIIPAISAEIQYFKAFKYVGINSRFFGYGMLNDNANNVGWRMRGILDNQSFLTTDAGLLLSIDVPIHIITTDWLGWAAAIFGPYDSQSPGVQKFWSFPRKLFGALNFELQISPFIDIALTRNPVTGRVFSPKDGFYDAGIEILIFPTRFKNYIVRGSVGFDLGRTLFKDQVDMSWRNPNTKKFEISFGLGLNY